MIRMRPEADTTPRARTASAACTLLGGSLRDCFHHERVDATQGVETGDAGQAGVNDCTDARDGQRGLGDIGRDDDFTAGARTNGAVLFLRG